MISVNTFLDDDGDDYESRELVLKIRKVKLKKYSTMLD